MSNNTSNNIRNITAVVGTAALILGMFTAGILYNSFGATLPERAVYTAVGLLLACSNALFPVLSAYTWNGGKPRLAVVMGGIWVVLACIQISAHIGFQAISQADRAAAGLAGQSLEAELKNINTKIEGLSAPDNLSSLKTKEAGILRRLDMAQARLLACPENHYGRCIDPARADIAAIQAELIPVQADIADAGEYESAQKQKALVLKQMAGLTSGETASIHPLFTTLGTVAAINPEKAQAVFLLATSVVLELVCAVSFISLGGFGGLKAAKVEFAGTPEFVPALREGGRVIEDGLAYLHADEIVTPAPPKDTTNADECLISAIVAAFKTGAIKDVRTQTVREWIKAQDGLSCGNERLCGRILPRVRELL